MKKNNSVRSVSGPNVIGLFTLLLSSMVIAQSSGELGSFEVDEDSSVRALERSLVQSGSLLLDPGNVDFETGIIFSYSENKTPILINNDKGEKDIGQTIQRRSKINIPISVKIGLPYDSQVNISIPIQTIDESFIVAAGNQAIFENENQGLGVGDARITISKTLLREKGALPDIIGHFTWDADNGKTSDNGIRLGGAGHNEYRAGVTATKRQDPLVFSASISAQASPEKNDFRPGNQYSLSLGTFLAASPKTSLKFSVDQTLVGKSKLNGKRIAGSDQAIGILNIGASSVITPQTAVSIATGIGLTDSSPDYTFNISMNTRLEMSAKHLNTVEVD